LTLQKLNEIISLSASKDEILRRLRENRIDNERAKINLDKMKQRDKELQLIIRAILEQYALGEMTQAAFTGLYHEYNNEKDKIAADVQSLENRIADFDRDKENVERFIEIINRYSVAKELSREMMLDLIEKIVVHEATGDHRRKDRQQVIEFHYHFVGNL